MEQGGYIWLWMSQIKHVNLTAETSSKQDLIHDNIFTEQVEDSKSVVQW
jgi:hypothetical protein